MEEFDTGSSFSSNKWTPGVAGYYQINALVSCVLGSGSGDAYIVLRKNGNWFKAGSRFSTSSFMPLSISTVIYLTDTDYIDIYALTSATVNTLATFGVGTNQAWVYFNGCYLRGV